MSKIIHVNTISELHQIFGATKPKHPLVTTIDFTKPEFANPNVEIGAKYVLGFYIISLKEFKGAMHYGRSQYDFEEGTMAFLSPGQVITMDEAPAPEVQDIWGLFIHPDLLRFSSLAEQMNLYSFFSYESSEALHVSEEEKVILAECLKKIEKEFSQNLDHHSQRLIVSNIELLLNYCLRFYDRQFITRTNYSKDTIIRFEKYLNSYFAEGSLIDKGMPTVKLCAEEMGLSPNYLSDLLKKETGKNTQEHIHLKVVEEAKNKLLGSNSSISEIAYDLGFEYPAHFSKMFKTKVGMSPLEYRRTGS